MSVSADGLGNVYISGRTGGDLGGTYSGNFDAFVAKYDSSGALQWTKQLGTTGVEYGDSVSADGLGNVYISGYTTGDLEGVSAGERDAFVAKYDSSGTLEWTRQWGATGFDQGNGVSADGLGNVYISGFTDSNWVSNTNYQRDVFVTKYDSSGALIWTRTLGTNRTDECYGVSADGLGNVYISGRTYGNMGGASAGYIDTFLAKYDSSGTLQWTEQLGTPDVEYALGVSADGLGNVYISGWTDGDLDGANTGRRDAFLAMYDSTGTLQWTEQLGTVFTDESFGVSADGMGYVYITGRTGGGLGGDNVGSYDPFVVKYDSSGTLQWTKQWGSVEFDGGRGVSADGLGNVYISGHTYGNMGGASAGDHDAFVTKIIPEPSTLVLLCIGAVGLLAWGSRRKGNQDQ